MVTGFRRVRRRVVVVLAAAAVVGGGGVAAPSPADAASPVVSAPGLAAPGACPWLDRAQRVLQGGQGSGDPRAPRLVPALQRAIATCDTRLSRAGSGAGGSGVVGRVSARGERPYFAAAD